MTELQKFATALEEERDPLLQEWRRQVRLLPGARDLDEPTLNDHVPGLLDEMACEFRSVSDDQSIPEALANQSGCSHGLQRLEEQYDIAEVVAEYNVLRGCLHDLATRRGVVLQGPPFHALNRVLDGAIGAAVQSFATQQALEVRKEREEYLSFVAHDLRTPLNAISISLAVLERRGIPEAAPLLHIVRRNIDTLAELVDKVMLENTALMPETVAELARRPLDLWPLVEDVVQELAPIANATSCRLVNRVPFEVGAYGDPDLLGRVFRNLLANAIKYTPGGEVEIGAVARGSKGAVECWVKDEGTGIAEDRLQVIFHRLETDPDRQGGTGLGLAIVKSFVEGHGGEVTVESREGVGSTFRFVLPGPD